MYRSNRGVIANALFLIFLNLVPAARGDVLVGSNRTNSVLRFDECTGQLIGEFIPSGSGGLMRPGGVATGPDGNLYVSSNSTNAFLRYNCPSRTFINVFSTATALT